MNEQNKNMVVVPVSILTPEWLEKRRGIFAELDRQLIQGVTNPGNGLTLEQLQLVIEHKNPFAVNPESLLADWRVFYRDELGIELGEVVIPPHRDEFDRLIVVARGLTIQKAYDKCAENFLCCKWPEENLDAAVPTNDRLSADGSYAIWVRDRIEADEEHKNKLAETIWQEKMSGITLLERLLFELKYFRESGKHLDIKNITLCSASRFTDGRVPRVDFGGRVVSVGRCGPGSARDSLCAREVVS